MAVSLIVDWETTGLPKPSTAELKDQPKGIELGLIRLENGVVVAEHNWMINPGEPITAEITKITGIKNEDLADKPAFKDIYDDVAKVFEGAEYFIAHNAPFDKRILMFELQRLEKVDVFPMPPNTVCSIAEYRHLYGRNMKLIELYERFVGEKLAQTHRALEDCQALLKTLQAAGYPL